MRRKTVAGILAGAFALAAMAPRRRKHCGQARPGTREEIGAFHS
jgi:hypothetical protein